MGTNSGATNDEERRDFNSPNEPLHKGKGDKVRARNGHYQVTGRGRVKK
jgi:hypothetical protein